MSIIDMDKMKAIKSKKIWIIGFVILGCLLFGINYYNTYQRAKKNAEELNVKILYNDQNQPFAVDCDLADMDYYHGSNELNLQKLAVYLYTYSLDKPENQVTIRDIQVFLSSEQAEDGTLMVYSRPDSLDKYIEWWWHGGSEKIRDFSDELVDYLNKNGFDYHYQNLDLEELQEILPLVKGNS